MNQNEPLPEGVLLIDGCKMSIGGAIDMPRLVRQRAQRVAMATAPSIQGRPDSARNLKLAADYAAATWPKASDSELMSMMVFEQRRAFAQEVACLTLWAIRWSESATPSLSVTDSLAAALALSDAPEDIDSLRAPWPAFLMPAPNWMRPASKIMVLAHEQEFSAHNKQLWSVQITLDEPDSPALWQCLQPLSTMLAASQTEEHDFRAHEFVPRVPVEDSERRMRHLVVRMLAGVLGLLRCGPVDGTYRSSGSASQAQTSPQRLERELRRHVVNIDFRERCAGYIAGTKRLYKSRWLVRGHWRNQACGQGLKERKHTWIMPYWKGHEGEPIIEKDYQL